MNKERRKSLAEAVLAIWYILNDIDESPFPYEIADNNLKAIEFLVHTALRDEKDTLWKMEDRFWATDRYSRFQDAVDELDYASDAIDEAKECFERKDEKAAVKPLEFAKDCIENAINA